MPAQELAARGRERHSAGSVAARDEGTAEAELQLPRVASVVGEAEAVDVQAHGSLGDGRPAGEAQPAAGPWPAERWGAVCADEVHERADAAVGPPSQAVAVEVEVVGAEAARREVAEPAPVAGEVADAHIGRERV